MITDGHMQYLFDEKGKRYAEKEGFLFRFSFFLCRRRRRRRSTSSSLMKLPPSFFFHSDCNIPNFGFMVHSVWLLGHE